MDTLPINEIVCGRNEHVLATFPSDCIDLTVTSPPYDNLRSYKGFEWDFDATARELWRVTKPGGVVVWVVADATVNGSETGTSFRQALAFMGLGFNLHDTMIYKIAGTGAKGSNYAYWQAFEYMFVFSKGRPKTVNRLADKINRRAGNMRQKHQRKQGESIDSDIVYIIQETGIRENVWEYHPGKNSDYSEALYAELGEHPAPFPEKLAEDHILSWSNPGDIVLDPFIGSGTTAKMAIKHHRRFIGIDISPEYCDLIRRRIAAVQPTLFDYSLAS